MLLQPFLALREGEPAQVLAAQEGRVEDVVDDLGVAPGLEGVLQALEAR